MARSVDEIFESLVAAKEVQAGLSELTSGSVTAVWRLLLYVVAVGCHVVELLLDEHRLEVDELLASRIPHRAKWYRDRALQFMADRVLVGEEDYYDESGMSDDEISIARVVKHAVAVEDGVNSMLTIKVAGELDGKRVPIGVEELRQFGAYIGEIKDAGVKVNIVNKAADAFNVSVDVYYDAMREGDHVKDACRKAIEDYIQNLPFNGEYSNMSLVDRLQVVQGVKVVEFVSANAREAGLEAATPINARYTAVAGYMEAETITLNMIAYE